MQAGACSYDGVWESGIDEEVRSGDGWYEVKASSCFREWGMFYVGFANAGSNELKMINVSIW